MKLPNELAADATFMSLYRLTVEPMVAGDREDVETVVAIAFMKGEQCGQGSVLETVRYALEKPE